MRRVVEAAVTIAKREPTRTTSLLAVAEKPRPSTVIVPPDATTDGRADVIVGVGASFRRERAAPLFGAPADSLIDSKLPSAS